MGSYSETRTAMSLKNMRPLNTISHEPLLRSDGEIGVWGVAENVNSYSISTCVDESGPLVLTLRDRSTITLNADTPNSFFVQLKSSVR